MIFSSYRSKERNEGRKKIAAILENRDDVFTIHYACESFDASNTPRITSISIQNLSTGESKSFNLHVEALKKQYDINRLTKVELDASERALLQNFYKFVKAQKCSWVHWNMKNSKYGFDALKNRYEILNPQKTAPNIRIQDRYDLSLLLKKLYGSTFETCETKGKLLNLARRNCFPLEGMLTGRREADAFDKKDFQAVMASSQAKAETIGLIAKAAGENRLKVATSIIEIYGMNAQGFLLCVLDHSSKIGKIASAIGGLFTLLNLVSLKTIYNFIIQHF